MPETTEHRVSASTTVGGLHPDAVHVSDNGDLGVGIHIEDAGIYVSLFGSLDDLRAVINKVAFELGKIRGSLRPMPPNPKPSSVKS